MIETMYAAPGVGLAAPQVGVPAADLRRSTSRSAAIRKGLIALVNPEFVERDGMQLEEEGCLSVPGLQRDRRPAGTRASVKGLDRDGDEHVVEGTDCSRVRSSTRWITSTARCSSIACAASSAT